MCEYLSYGFYSIKLERRGENYRIDSIYYSKNNRVLDIIVYIYNIYIYEEYIYILFIEPLLLIDKR